MKRAVPIALLIASTRLSLAQAPAPPPPVAPAAHEEVLDHWRRATVALGVVVIDGTVSRFLTAGSAVVVAVDTHRGCLLTAKHMVVDPATGKVAQHLWMRFPSINGETEQPIELPLFAGDGSNLWKTSDDGGDLVTIPLPEAAWAHPSGVDGVLLASFADPKEDVYQGAVIVALGYPQIVGEAFLTTPIARNGIIAWVNPHTPADEVFLVDANLYNGNSGGPVFHVRNGMDRYGHLDLGGGIAFLGIVSRGPLQNAPVISADGIIYQENPVTHAKNQVTAIVANVGGIGIIEPAAKARRLIESMFPPASPPSVSRHPAAASGRP